MVAYVTGPLVFRGAEPGGGGTVNQPGAKRGELVGWVKTRGKKKDRTQVAW